jgi:hypothetical protein
MREPNPRIRETLPGWRLSDWMPSRVEREKASKWQAAQAAVDQVMDQAVPVLQRPRDDRGRYTRATPIVPPATMGGMPGHLPSWLIQARQL